MAISANVWRWDRQLCLACGQQSRIDCPGINRLRDVVRCAAGLPHRAKRSVCQHWTQRRADQGPSLENFLVCFWPIPHGGTAASATGPKPKKPINIDPLRDGPPPTYETPPSSTRTSSLSSGQLSWSSPPSNSAEQADNAPTNC